MSTSVKVDGLIDSLRSRILSGEFGNEGRLPSFRSLAEKYSTTQETMNKTMQALQAEGLLISMGVKGVFVNTLHVRLGGITGNFYKYLQEHVSDPLQEYIDPPEVMKASAELAQAMNLEENDLVLRRFMRQGTQQIIFRLDEAFYPEKLLTPTIIDQAKKDPLFVPLPNIKDKFGLAIKHVKEEVLCRLPSEYEQNLLKIVRNNPVIDVRRTHYAKDKKTVILYMHMILNANHFLLSYNYEVDLFD